jgi:hypothetical protein
MSYVDLYSAVRRSQARVPLVRQAGPGTHLLRLTVSRDHNQASMGNECIVDAFEVLEKRSPAFPTTVVTVLGVAWIACWALLIWRLRRLGQRMRLPH